MSAVDFEQWATPALQVTLGGRTFEVQPPSVDDAKKILAAAVRGEIHLGIVKAAEVPDGIVDVLSRIQPGEHFALGEAYAQMVEAGVPTATIDRVAYYAVFYWARGKRYADALAELLWTPREQEAPPAGDANPKGG